MFFTLALGAPLWASSEYDKAGEISALNARMGLIEVDGQVYSVSFQTGLQYDNGPTQRLDISDLREGEYIQLVTEGTRIIKLRRYRAGPLN